MKVIVLKNNIKQFEISVLDDDLVNGGELFIGREDDCHIILDSQQISRHHAKIYFSENKLKLETLSNFGGVKINGHEVSLVDLNISEQIEVDQYQIRVENFQGYVEEELEEDIDKALDAEMALNEAVVEQNYDDTTEILDTVEEEIVENELEEELLEEELPDSEVLDDDFIDSSLDDIVEDENLDGDILDGDDNLDPLEDIVSDDVPDENSGDSSSDNFDDENFSEDSEEGFSETDDFSDGDAFSEEENFDSGDGDGFGDDGGFEEDDDSKTQVFNSFATYYLKIFGEYAPFDSYKIEDNLTNIGREEETCQILLSDPEVSKIHAVIKKTLVNCTIQDNNSSNGIILNGERVNKAELTNGDEFIIGDTSFTVIINSDLLNSEQGRLMPVEENQEIIIEDDSEGGERFGEGDEGVDFNEETAVEVVVEKSFIKRILKNPKQRIYLFIVIGVFVIFMLDAEPEKEEVPKDSDKTKVVKEKEPKTKLRQDILDRLEVNYSLALAKYENGQYTEAKEYISKVKLDDPTYKLTASLDKSIQESLDAITRAKEEEALKKQRLLKLKRVKDLVEKARKAVSEKNVAAAKNYFSSVYELDPENIDIPPLKIEIESYVEMEKRKKQEIALLKAKRAAMVDKLRPGKRLFIKGKWYNSVSTLEKFLNDKEMDEDLIKEATTMLTTSKRKLLLMIDPLISKARSYKEGQDLKLAYETFGDVLKYDPSNEESLNERTSIFEVLNKRSKKIFREGLIKEDLSDFSNAKEKFQEVQQISPINSEYYNKATDKLKRYLE